MMGSLQFPMLRSPSTKRTVAVGEPGDRLVEGLLLKRIDSPPPWNRIDPMKVVISGGRDTFAGVNRRSPAGTFLTS